MQFHLLMQDREGRFVPITVTGASSPQAAINMVATAELSVIGFRDSHQQASQEATQRNTAAGFVTQGCSTCG